jgi:hypothetical protein
MKQRQIQLTGFVVSATSRTYSFAVIDPSGDTRQFQVDVLLELFSQSPLKFQDGPLITRERLEFELDQETADATANRQLSISEPDIVGYLKRHYPPKARAWNHYKPTENSY